MSKTVENMEVGETFNHKDGSKYFYVDFGTFITKEDAKQFKIRIEKGLELLDKELTCPQYRLSVTQYKELKEKADEATRLTLKINERDAKIKRLEEQLRSGIL
jgi:hypothetical protein